jgi:hypothetical protein
MSLPRCSCVVSGEVIEGSGAWLNRRGFESDRCGGDVL